MPSCKFVRNGNRIQPLPAVCKKPPTAVPLPLERVPLTLSFDYRCNTTHAGVFRAHFTCQLHPEAEFTPTDWSGKWQRGTTQFAFALHYRKDQENFILTIDHSAIPAWQPIGPYAWHQPAGKSIDSGIIRDATEDPLPQTVILRVLA